MLVAAANVKVIFCGHDGNGFDEHCLFEIALLFIMAS